MAFTLRTLRVGLVVGAALLVAVVAGFVWYAQRATHSWLKKLPRQLGIHIVQETDHFTYSQSLKGKTVFTVRAAKESTYDDGKVKLRDAGIELYGRQDGKADRIHGAEFDFDQKAGVLTAVGDVYIDLAAPESKGGTAADDDARMIHVKTSGLVFNQKARTAVTDERVEFAASGMTGTAVGADYDSGDGVVVLRSAVHLSGLRNEKPVVLVASHAVMDRPRNVVTLEQARYQTPGESVAGDHAVVTIDGEGTPQHLEAQGHVVLTGVGKGTATGDRLEMAMNVAGQPRDGRLWGGVVFREKTEVKEERGQAEDVRVGFDTVGRPEHAVMTGGVQMEERAGTVGRALRAERVEMRLSEAVKGRVVVEEATATGSGSGGAAALRLAEANEKGRSATDVSADTLVARFAADGSAGRGGRTERVTGVTGTGHTVVHQVGVNGVEETSAGEALEVSFAADGRSIQRAVQRGGVKTVRSVPTAAAGKGKSASVQHAAADVATYDGAADVLTLTGMAQVSDETSEMTADRVELERKSGDAKADGNVRVSYLAADGKGEPMHVTAASAVERHEARTAEFYGAAGKNARMWQGLSQVEAPVLHFEDDKAGKRLIANGGDGVRAVLVSDGEKRSTEKIFGRQMTYSEQTREVVFAGPVRMEEAGSTVVAKEATAYLAAVGAAAGGAAAGGAASGGAAASAASPGIFPGGKVERFVATGAVQVEEPGRRATGERLVYTAADGTFVMTGTKAVRPKMVDDEQGMVTGASLRFRSGDKAVMVSGDEAGGSTGRVHSETRVKQP